MLFNVFEALAPGSGFFYVNDTARTVSYAPAAGEAAPSELSVIVPVLTTVVSIQAPFVVMENLNISHATDGGARATGQAG